jgi:hypothetical protein
MYSNLRYACANGFVVLAEGLDVFRRGAVATGGNMNPSGNLSCTKRTLVGSCYLCELALFQQLHRPIVFSKVRYLSECCVGKLGKAVHNSRLGEVEITTSFQVSVKEVKRGRPLCKHGPLARTLDTIKLIMLFS